MILTSAFSRQGSTAALALTPAAAHLALGQSGPEVTLTMAGLSPASRTFAVLWLQSGASGKQDVFSTISMNGVTVGTIDPFQLTLFTGGAGATGGAQVGQTTRTGMRPGSAGGEGAISLTNVSFDYVTLTDTNGGRFGVGNIRVTDAPEPGSFWLAAPSGLAFIWVETPR